MTDNTPHTERMEALTAFNYVKQHLDCSDETAALLVVADELVSLRYFIREEVCVSLDTISESLETNISSQLDRIAENC